MKKLTASIINERLSSRQIEMIGEYINSSSKSIFRCENNHEWSAIVTNVLKENNCPHCSNRAVLTKEIVNERLKEKNIEMIGDYVHTKKITEFRCEKDHIWRAAPGHVMTDTGCPYCSNRVLLTKDIINERLVDRSIKLIGKYLGMQRKTVFSCKLEHEWTTTPDSILNQKTSCPGCATYGFNPNKPATAYILKFETYIKYGISNDINRRLKTHKTKNGNYEIVATKTFAIGKDALEWENNIKKHLGMCYVSKDMCRDGYTETLSEDKLQTLLDTLDK